MGRTTGIEWTERTWNPWVGCSRVSPGCDNCYMFTEQRRYGHDPSVVRRTLAQTFNAPLKWARQGFTGMVFTCSWSDFFHQHARAWLPEAWEIMRATPGITYQVLTKRPGLAVAWYRTHDWLPNVWLGTSVESAKYLPRLDVLSRVPAPVRFVSAEPLLGPLDLQRRLIWRGNVGPQLFSEFDAPAERDVDWVICGGESGDGFRFMETAWVEAIARQCKAANVPLFVKQDSGRLPGRKGKLPKDLWAMKQVPGAA